MGPTEPRNGRTFAEALLEELWKELDTVVEHIMAEDEPDVWEREDDGEESGSPLEWQKYGEWRGQAQGLAYALAIIANPYQPDVNAIRTEAMERWERGEDDG